MDDINHLELTPSLLRFYRSRIHDLQKSQNYSILNRLNQIELSWNERSRLERELAEAEDELDQTTQSLDDVQNALVKERRAVIELVEENAHLRGTSFRNES